MLNKIEKPELIVLDLDGTTLNSENRIPENLKGILKDLEQSSICRTVLASGRSYISMIHIARELNLSLPMITLNGGVIAEPESGSILYEKLMPTDTFNECLDVFRNIGMDYVVFTPMGVYADKPSEITRVLNEFSRYDVEISGECGRLQNPVKVLFFQHSREELERIRDFTRTLDVDITESGFSFTEILPKGINKGTALEFLSESLEIPVNRIIAFGDNENDIEMIKYAGTGVAMGNSIPEVKRAADIVTSSNDEDGVYRVLKDIFEPVNEPVLSCIR